MIGHLIEFIFLTMQQLSLYWFEGLDELVDRPGGGSEEGLMHLENGSRPAVTPHVKTLRVMTCCFLQSLFTFKSLFAFFIFSVIVRMD